MISMCYVFIAFCMAATVTMLAIASRLAGKKGHKGAARAIAAGADAYAAVFCLRLSPAAETDGGTAGVVEVAVYQTTNAFGVPTPYGMTYTTSQGSAGEE